MIGKAWPALALGLTAFSSAVWAAPAPVHVGPAAFVNGSMISSYDLDQRVALFKAISGKPETPETRNQVLTGLVNEAVEMQEAAKRNISIGKDELNKALQYIADNNHVTGEQLLASLKQQGIAAQTLVQQIAAEMTWQKVVYARFGADIKAGDMQPNEAMTSYLNELRRDATIQMR
jgi:peptidyl-prolyl cis-trans isomerase SurA